MRGPLSLSRFFALSALLLVLFCGGMASALTAQDFRVIHLWVDPHSGNDSSASILNPKLSVSCQSNGCNSAICPPSAIFKPNDDDNNKTGPGPVLLHAPYPFKTINGAQGALSYIPTLPYTSPITGVVWEYAIIHLLPGIYAPVQVNAQFFHNGLIRNGEVFPIRLPSRVSVKGTSALNTIFELENHTGTPNVTTKGPVFEFGASTANDGFFSFIDRVTIFGAPPNLTGTVLAHEASAIYLNPAHASTPTITNSFLVGNGAAVVVDAPNDAQTPFHQVTLVGNTIAFNDVGIWNGQSGLTSGSKGVSKLLLLNNIFDAQPPQPLVLPAITGCTAPPPAPATWLALSNYAAGTPFGITDFEGVDAADLVVATPLPALDFNAYEQGCFDLGVHLANLGLPPTAVRTTQPPLVPPLDIAAVTGGGPSVPGGFRRGILYVRDLMHEGGQTVGGPFAVSCNFDRSPLDFRLSPAEGLATNVAPPVAPTALNRLVDQGWSGSFPLTMQNGMQLTAPPGTLPLSGSSGATWLFNSWNEDCEGYGNPRIVDHPIYGNGPAGAQDVGADEVDRLIGVGLRAGSSMYLIWNRFQPLTQIRSDNDFFWLLGAPTGLGSPPVQPPAATLPYVTNSQNAPGWTFQSPSQYYLPFVSDIYPHLLPDIHPYWNMFPGFGPSDPIWQVCINSQGNSTLFTDPMAGIINPVGTFPSNPPNFAWLDGSFPLIPGPFGPFSSGAPTSVASFDAWCRNGGAPDRFRGGVVPSGVRFRFALEHKIRLNEMPWFVQDDGPANIQTFMVVTK